MSEGDKEKFVPPAEAKEDADGFWIMPDKSFYDPDGYFFDSEGKDEFGGYYNEEGVYVSPNQNEDQTGEEEVKEEKDVPQGYAKHSNFIPKVEGASFNEAGFYILPNNTGFYDPLGNYFDKDGYDLTGGYYDDGGQYVPGDSGLIDELEDQGIEAGKEENEQEIKEKEKHYADKKFAHDPDNYELESEEVVINQTEEKAEIAISEKKVEQDSDEEEEGVTVTKISAK